MTTINSLNTDCFNHIMSYLPVEEEPLCRVVCRLWRNRLETEHFPNRFFTQKLHSFVTLDTIVKRFKKQIRTFQILSFENCQELTDDNLSSIAKHVRICELRFRNNPHITEGGICALVPRLLSPARLTVRDGCPGVRLATVIDALRANKIQVQALNFKNFKMSRNLIENGLSVQKRPQKTEAETALVAFIEHKLLVSPCSLNFKRMEEWNSKILFTTLVKLNVVVASLNLGYNFPVPPLPVPLKTTTPVTLRIPYELENNTMIEANRLLTSFGRFELMDSEFLETVALKHLCNEGCNIELHQNHVGSTSLAEALVKRQIKKLCLPNPTTALNTQGINLLLSQGNFQKIKLGRLLLFGETFLNDEYVKSLVRNANQPTSLTILANCSPLQFREIFGKKRLAGLPMKFTYRSEFITQEYIDVLAESGVTFERLKINSSIPLSFEPLMTAKLLEKCRTLELANCNHPCMLELISSLNIKKLNLKHLRDFESVKSIFSDRTKFKNLTDLTFRITNVNNTIVYTFLKQVRPNLTVHFV